MTELLGDFRTSYPSRIALLLPLSSPQQTAAQAVRDGFIAAHLSNPDGTGSRLKIYDTALLGVTEAYLQAQMDGANFIVGPLLKPGVEEIERQAGFIPTLALNFTQSNQPPPAGFFQFTLAPEDEAREVARHAVANGAATAVALVPNNDWGIRLLNSFQAEFETLGGELLQFRGYDTDTQDFSLAITTLLNLANSDQRFQRLAANLRVPVEFEPRRRQDVDIIFVAALPSTGRLLAPQLRFHYAGDIPTYATSDVHVPGTSAGNNDLNGLLFPDTPWVLLPNPGAEELKQTLQRYWPQRAPALIRLYGLGFDAYRLIPLLYSRRELFTPVSGMSGELTLELDGRIHRRLPFAQFRNGRPVALGSDTLPQEAEPRELADSR
jgi:outer membrane PBP1 activator LpoA protein